MANDHGRAALRRARRYKTHDGVPKLAAELAGCSLSFVYRVRNGKAKSPAVEQAIRDAERRLAEERAA